jgi:hypothetical protein
VIVRVPSVCLALAFAVWAQNGPYVRDWKPPVSENPRAPQRACAELRSLSGFDFTVATTVLEPASQGAPEFCRVTGQVPPEVRFEVSLPTAWNRRLYMFGNGGYAGENLENPNRLARRDEALRLGFSVAQTNTGHDAAKEPLGTFAVDAQKLYDYAFRAVHVTTVTAKRLAEAYYGSAPERSYFNGCSTGGRQALIAAQRFPEDFDGIIVGAPVLNFTGTMVSYANTAQTLTRGPLPVAKLEPLAKRIYALCDGKDGLEDGLIDDPRRCGFDPARDLPRCADGADAPDCFTPAQIATLTVLYGDIVSQGKRVFPGWPVGAEIGEGDRRSGWDPWIVREGSPTISVVFGETFFRYLAFPKKNPDFRLRHFDLDRDLPRLDWIHKVLDATDTDLSAFQKRGGKLLMWYGWADPALNPLMAVEYYQAVLERMGSATRDFFRLFMLPGVFHCGGGPGCGAFDPLRPVIEWVEQGKAPERLEAARIEEGKTLRTRPLCPYPQVARYKGSGSVDDAASFACVDPDAVR